MAEGRWAAVGTTRLAWTVRLFRAGGVDVRFHWPWLWLPLVLPPAVRPGDYSSWPWYVAEAVVLAGLLLLHEAGHALACRLVGGRPVRIALWGGGGLTEMEVPLRPGAWLAVMLAGPAVNGLLALAALALPTDAGPDLDVLLHTAARVNLAVLGFNLLPIYPLDGGQVLHALLWQALGWAKGLMVTGLVSLVILLGTLALSGLFLGWMAVSVGVMLAFNWGLEAAPLWRLAALDPAWFGEDHDRAIAAATEVLERDPRYPWAYLVRAEAHRHKGDLGPALADADAAVRAAPRLAKAHAARGDVYREMGRHAEAEADHAAALRLAPPGPTAASPPASDGAG